MLDKNVGKETFEPSSYKRMVLGGGALLSLALACGIVFVLVSDGNYPPLLVAGAVIFGLVSVYAAYSFVRFRSFGVEMDTTGIAHPKGAPLRWEDIASIKADMFGQKLRVVDTSGNQCVTIRYDLNGFENVATQTVLRAERVRKRYESLSGDAGGKMPPPYAIRENMLIEHGASEIALCDMREIKSVGLDVVKQGSILTLALLLEESDGVWRLIKQANSCDSLFPLFYGLCDYLHQAAGV